MKVTRELVLAALGSGAKSVSAVGKALGAKGNVSGSLTKKIREVVPEIADLLKGGAVQAQAPAETGQTAAAVKIEASAKGLGEKAKALARLAATGNPFKKDSMIAVVFEHGAKALRPKGVILTEAANDKRFVAYCRAKNGGKDMPMGDMKHGRFRMAYHKYTIIRGAHPGNHGVTDWKFAEGQKKHNGMDVLVQAVAKAE